MSVTTGIGRADPEVSVLSIIWICSGVNEATSAARTAGSICGAT